VKLVIFALFLEFVMLVTGGFHRPSVRPRCRGNRLAAAAAL